jgi:hypothetical protein
MLRECLERHPKSSHTFVRADPCCASCVTTRGDRRIFVAASFRRLGGLFLAVIGKISQILAKMAKWRASCLRSPRHVSRENVRCDPVENCAPGESAVEFFQSPEFFLRALLQLEKTMVHSDPCGGKWGVVEISGSGGGFSGTEESSGDDRGKQPDNWRVNNGPDGNLHQNAR